MVTVQDGEVIRHEGRSFVAIPDDWEGLREGKVLQIVDDVVLPVPSYVANATGELLVIRVLEWPIAMGVIRPDYLHGTAERPVQSVAPPLAAGASGTTPERRPLLKAQGGVADPVA